MSDLTIIEKRKLERELEMEMGYVLEFSNKTFMNFFIDTVGINIYKKKYSDYGPSKANRMRTFWDKESNVVVAKVLEALVNCWDEYSHFESPPSEDFIKIMNRLKYSTTVPEIDDIKSNNEDKDFESLAKAVRESIHKGEPEAGLDRLHTFLIKYFRSLCEKHHVQIKKEMPLQSLLGMYYKTIKSKGLIESDITERILKSSISVMDEFNKVRNNYSFAHDNKLLNTNESWLIVGYVSSCINFIEHLENTEEKSDENSPEEDFPF